MFDVIKSISPVITSMFIPVNISIAIKFDLKIDEFKLNI